VCNNLRKFVATWINIVKSSTLLTPANLALRLSKRQHYGRKFATTGWSGARNVKNVMPRNAMLVPNYEALQNHRYIVIPKTRKMRMLKNGLKNLLMKSSLSSIEMQASNKPTLKITFSVEFRRVTIVNPFTDIIGKFRRVLMPFCERGSQHQNENVR
jgi:hypothetical protein